MEDVVEVAEDFLRCCACLLDFGNPRIQFFSAIVLVEPNASSASMPTEISQIRSQMHISRQKRFVNICVRNVEVI
jgi:hypothetical protein